MTRQSTARPAHEMKTIIRRPPRLRSRAGPTIGAITANGAIVSAR
jgi:hypothetical protein